MTWRCPEALIEFAGRLADASGGPIRRHFRARPEIEAKADASPVTIADREAEAAMRALIVRGQPDHGVIGEEFGNARADAEWVWVLDPIDGTKSFITGRPIFGTLIALLRHGAPVLGVIDQPVLGERWIGAAGRPTTFNGVAVATRACPALEAAILGTTSPDLFRGADCAAFARLDARVRHTVYGGDCYNYAQLAAGNVDLVVEAGLAAYDFCALVPVVERAGGVITDWTGAPLRPGSDGRVIAAGDAALHRLALSVLAGEGGAR